MTLYASAYFSTAVDWPQKCFNLFERIPDVYEVPSVAPSATDGFWAMLKPLPPGRHKLEFRAFYTIQNSAHTATFVHSNSIVVQGPQDSLTKGVLSRLVADNM